MKFFVRAIVTGFALSLGSALFKKLAPQLGLDDKKDKDDEQVNAQDGATDPGLHSKFS
jgi:hypothetical protein